MNNLCLHSGATVIDVEALNTVATPEPTQTWTPVPHDFFLRSVRRALVASGANVTTEEHAIYKGGDRYFGLLHLGDNTGGGNVTIGLRNSHDKTFPAGLSLGNHVFVCDNLSFCGDVVVSRRHTRYILADLDRVIYKAVGQLSALKAKQTLRFDAYRDHALTDMEAHDLMVRALLAKVVSGEALAKVVHEWREPRHEDFQPRNVWSLFNDFTEVLKPINPVAVVQRTMTLHGLLDAHCHVAV